MIICLHYSEDTRRRWPGTRRDYRAPSWGHSSFHSHARPETASRATPPLPSRPAARRRRLRKGPVSSIVTSAGTCRRVVALLPPCALEGEAPEGDPYRGEQQQER